MSDANLEFITQAFLRHGKEAFDMTWNATKTEWLIKYYFNQPNCDDVNALMNLGLVAERNGYGMYGLTDKAISLIEEKLNDPD